MSRMEEKILNHFKIVSSPQRIELLRLISMRKHQFTVNDLKEDVKHVSVVIYDSTLVTTIQLFHTRHLLLGSSGQHGDKGRPPMRYTLSAQVTEMFNAGA